MQALSSDLHGYIFPGAPDWFPLQFQSLASLEPPNSGRNFRLDEYLVIFDRRPDVPPAEDRTRMETARTPTGREVQVLRA